MTSSDAAVIYDSRMNFRPLEVLVIYLGNNEGAGGRPKPFHNYHLWSLLFLFKVLRRTKSLKQFDIRPKFLFRYEENLAPSVVVSPVDFKKNSVICAYLKTLAFGESVILLLTQLYDGAP